MVDTMAVTITAWVITVAITAEQAIIAAAISTRGIDTAVITPIVITAATAITTPTIGVFGMAVGTPMASARAGVGRTIMMNSFGSATETG